MQMIAKFPKFSKLKLIHQKEIDLRLKNLPPYSDFNFVSMWSYNTESDMTISILRENLVVKFRDYTTNQPFYSFFGTNQVEKTAAELLDMTPILKLIPEVTAKKIGLGKGLEICEDTDNHDYVISLVGLAEVEGKKNANKRREINKLLRLHPKLEFRLINTGETAIRREIENIYRVWADNKKKSEMEKKFEYKPIRRIMRDFPAEKLLSIGVYDKDKMIGFSISEILSKKYAMGHFMKADVRYDGIFPYIENITAMKMLEAGATYLNCEQDLGLPNLKKAKQIMRPVFYLKKYIITRKEK